MRQSIIILVKLHLIIYIISYIFCSERQCLFLDIYIQLQHEYTLNRSPSCFNCSAKIICKLLIWKNVLLLQRNFIIFKQTFKKSILGVAACKNEIFCFLLCHFGLSWLLMCIFNIIFVTVIFVIQLMDSLQWNEFFMSSRQLFEDIRHFNGSCIIAAYGFFL